MASNNGVVSPIERANADDVRAHLRALFRPAQEHYSRGLIEIAYGEDKPNRAAFFTLSDDGIDQAVSHAVNENGRGCNVYVGVNPRKSNTDLRGRADANDIEIAFYQFADIDRADAASSAARGLPVPPTMIVMTGTVPNDRPHLYWQMVEPTRNLSAWTAIQEGLRDTLGGDSVTNPDRIMRLAGTVNYPSLKKTQGRGYQREVVRFYPDQGDGLDITPDMLVQAYPKVARQPARDEYQPQDGRYITKIDRAIQDALADREWHNNALKITAGLARKGLSDETILLLTSGLARPGYSQQETREDLLDMIVSARGKYDIPHPVDTDDDPLYSSDIVQADEPDDIFETLSLDELENLPAPTYLIDQIIPEHGLTFIYGDPGSGKSFIALDMAMRIAFGMDWHGETSLRTGVLYIAGEGKHGLGKRVKGWRREHALEGVDAPFKLLPVAVHMLDRPSVEKLKRTIRAVCNEVDFKIGLIIIDTVSRAIPGQDENKQDTMSLFVDGCAELHNFTDGAVIGVHHAGKDKEKGMRGSTVLLGGCEASIKVIKEESVVTLSIEKQKDDEAASEIFLDMKKVEWTDAERAISTLVPLKGAKQLVEERPLTRRMADAIFDEIDRAWNAKNPWSNTPNSKNKGRYLPKWINEEFGVSYGVAETHIQEWLQREYLIMDRVSRDSQARALRVEKRLDRHD